MRYVKGHGLQTRSRIVENASYGLRQNGADGVSVVDLMKLAGLTHGGFYSHFDSREVLVIEAFAQAMDRTVADWLKIMKGMPIEERFDAVVDAYLSPRHRDNAAGDETLSDDILEAGRQALRSRSAARRSSRQHLRIRPINKSDMENSDHD